MDGGGCDAIERVQQVAAQSKSRQSGLAKKTSPRKIHPQLPPVGTLNAIRDLENFCHLYTQRIVERVSFIGSASMITP
jgi:hypothetical protein